MIISVSDVSRAMTVLSFFVVMMGWTAPHALGQSIVGSYDVCDSGYGVLGEVRFDESSPGSGSGTFTASIPGGVNSGTWRRLSNGDIFWDSGEESSGYIVFVSGEWLWGELISGQTGILVPN